MRRLWILLTTFLLTFSSSALADESPSVFMDKWLEAFNKNDAKYMSSFYDESDKTECLVSLGGWLRGYEAIKNMYTHDMRVLRFHDSKAEGMQEQVMGEAAVVSFVHKFKYQDRDTKATYKIHIRTTVTLKKHKKSWKIVSEHSSPIGGIPRAILVDPEKNGKGAKFKHLILLDVPTEKMARALRGRTLKDIEIKDLSVRKSLEYMLDSGSVKKGNYGSLILLFEKSQDKHISIAKKSMNMADCIEEICQQAGFKWTIYFYAGNLEYPMLVVGSEEMIMKYKKAKKMMKEPREQ